MTRKRQLLSNSIRLRIRLRGKQQLALSGVPDLMELAAGDNRGGQRHLYCDASDLLRVGAVRPRLGIHGRDARLRQQDVLRSLGRTARSLSNQHLQ